MCVYQCVCVYEQQEKADNKPGKRARAQLKPNE